MKKRDILNLSIVFLLVNFIFLSGCVNEENLPKENEENVNGSVIYLIYSSFCPHCHYMMSYLEDMHDKYPSISVVKIEDGSEYAKYLEDHYGYKWDGGVPLLFGILRNGTLILIKGYPTDSQEKNGYFMGKEYEKKMCDNMKGEKIYLNNEYSFCKLPNGVILGNKYAVNYLLTLCQEQGCVKIPV